MRWIHALVTNIEAAAILLLLSVGLVGAVWLEAWFFTWLVAHG